MQCWTTSQASSGRLYIFTLAALGLIAAIGGCGAKHSLGPAPRVGDVVGDVLGLEVAAAPGGLPCGRLRGSPALVVEVSNMGGRETWYRLLGADGSYGWSPRVAQRAFPSRVKTGEATFALLEPSPDDPLFAEKAHTIRVTSQDGGTVEGASRQPRISSMEKLLIPERLNPFNTPWLKLRVGSVTGWLPPSHGWLYWGEQPIGAPGGTYAAMDRLGLGGLIRPPFLGPVLGLLRNLAPIRDDDHVLYLTDNNRQPKPSTAGSAGWGDAELLLRRAEGPAQTISTVVVFPRGQTRAFTFMASNRKTAHAVIESYPPLVTDYTNADLDHDGLNEWLLEMVQTYGDGYYSTLWLVDGRSLMDSLRIYTLALGGASGEGDTAPVDAFWWVDYDDAGKASRIWIVRTGPDSAEAVPFSYTRERVTLSATGKAVFAAIVADAPSYFEAQQKSLSLAQKMNRMLPVFAVRKDGLQRWAVGRIFEQRGDADAWIKRWSGPADGWRVVELPVGSERVGKP